MPYNANENEQQILSLWEETEAFAKSVSSRPENRPYVFYDGPPFATGLPHYGHILSSVIKDVVPRYWTMKGYRVRRRWGWDCHGLPIESLIEKQMGVSGKKDIEEKIGVAEFNEACRATVLMYTKEWKKMVARIGRWVEFDSAYRTMDPTYMESVWWALKTIWDKNLIYEGRKVLMYCPRCETPVAKAEVAMDNSYKDITEESVTAKFKLKTPGALNASGDVYILAWTTTPWTLPANVALAVGRDIEYVLCRIESSGEVAVVAKDRAEAVLGAHKYQVEKTIKGVDLLDLEYEPLYQIPAVEKSGQRAWRVVPGDFVTTQEGTGIVHTAVIYGEDDYNLGVACQLPMVPLLDERGHFNSQAPQMIQGQYFKKAEKTIKDDLENRGRLFSRSQHTHSYPHCWRCDTQLFYNAISAWFINIEQVKPRLIELNEKINWYPGHLKQGRFLNILETAPDWNISRNRYWATPLPFWKCTAKDCPGVACLGSVAEMKDRALNFSEVYQTDKVEEMDLHKHLVDRIRLRCQECGGEMRRIPEVIDCWVESGSMPFAEFHYPFANKETFEARFPGEYVAEYIAQTRAWFYYMHALAAILFDNVSFENVVATGTILNEKGEKLSKSKRNYTDPWIIIEQYGVDALRYYLMTSVVMQAENLFFNDREVRDAYNKVVNTLWNVLTFYLTFVPAGGSVSGSVAASKHVLDRWIISRLHELTRSVTRHMDNYDTVKAARPIKDFIDDLSTWYVRRSRDRFKDAATDSDEAAVAEAAADKESALATLREVLLTLSKVMAPFTPFISEKIYQELSAGSDARRESVHLEDWPRADESKIDGEVLARMALARSIVETGLSIRAEQGVRVRQVLARLIVNAPDLPEEYRQIIAAELNVKEVVFGPMPPGLATKKAGDIEVGLDTALTDELRLEGLLREVVRTINQLRKDQGLTIRDFVVVCYSTGDPLLASVFRDYADEIRKNVLARELAPGGTEEVMIDGRPIRLSIEA